MVEHTKHPTEWCLFSNTRAGPELATVWEPCKSLKANFVVTQHSGKFGVRLWVIQLRASWRHFAIMWICWHNCSLPKKPSPLQNLNISSWSWMEEHNSHGNIDKHHEKGHKVEWNEMAEFVLWQFHQITSHFQALWVIKCMLCGHCGADQEETKVGHGAGSALTPWVL